MCPPYTKIRTQRKGFSLVLFSAALLVSVYCPVPVYYNKHSPPFNS
jgi:hypothetical protein